MSESDEPGTVREALRTVSPTNMGHPDVEMDVIGLGIALGILLLFLPLLPFIAIVYALVWLVDRVRRQAA